ncbi:venom allergen 3 [Drosophila mojavensis]|uniref:SCP domain-containing protein n=1 Tax=Drosophila mojavensis TaxID=7230 RepID=B4KNV1_DROMO|nr:venom allergen 3 [Drosophila mojavensis]EDW08996.1 uncharacterized protein Dmoj_GI19264 [Drosophila mojavensis]
MKILALRLLRLLLLLILQQARAFNFCNNKQGYCELAQSKHFMCRLNTEMKPIHDNISLVVAIPDTYLLRERIIQYHNEFRDAIASGTVKNKFKEYFPPGGSMQELVWDLELAYMARRHVTTLSFRHSKCRAVKRFPLVGESLSMVIANTKHINLTVLLDLTLREMFHEYKTCPSPKSFVTKLNIALYHESFGHLALMVNDRVSRVGCGFAVAKRCNNMQKTGYCYLMTCHYNYNIIGGSRVYKKGTPASDCKRWETSPSVNYLNLCANSGKIFRTKTEEDINYMESLKPKI